MINENRTFLTCKFAIIIVFGFFVIIACGGGNNGISNTNPQQVGILPEFFIQPLSKTTIAGQSVSFTVLASGSPSPTIQWERSADSNNWISIPNANSETYNFTPIISDNGSLFRAKATNTAGSAISNSVTLLVNPITYPLTINSGPGVTGSPIKTQRYIVGTTVNYEFSLQPGYTNLQVKLDDYPIDPKGTITMNSLHNITVSATSTNPDNKLIIDVEGLTGVDADIIVTGPDSYSQHLSGTQTLTGLPVGRYTITSATVLDVSQPGLGRANEGLLGPEFLARHPLQLTQVVELNGDVGIANVKYPPVSLTVQIPVKDNSDITVPIEFVLIPPGSFQMGSDIWIDNYGLSAQPVHTVTIATAFYLAKTELTQAQWKAVMGVDNNPSYIKGDSLPVTQASWEDFHSTFLIQMATMFPNYGFRLPSEAEWEYSCRANTNSAFFCGNDSSYLHFYAVYYSDKPSPVASRAPNPWGLYDIVGNVQEWCQDAVCEYSDAPVDGSPYDPPGNNFARIARGGGYCYTTGAYEPDWTCRSAFRQSGDNYFRGHYDKGYRLALPVPAAN